MGPQAEQEPIPGASQLLGEHNHFFILKTSYGVWTKLDPNSGVHGHNLEQL